MGLKNDGTITEAQIPSTIATDAEVATAVSDHAALAAPHVGRAVSLTASAPQTIPTGVLTRATFWDTEGIDDAAYHEGVTNPSRITIPAGLGGLYVVNAPTWWANGAIGVTTVLQTRLYLNGVVVPNGVARDAPGAGFGTFGQDSRIVAILRLVATDYLEVFAFHDKTAAGTLDIGAATTAFQAVRIDS